MKIFYRIQKISNRNYSFDHCCGHPMLS